MVMLCTGDEQALHCATDSTQLIEVHTALHQRHTSVGKANNLHCKGLCGGSPMPFDRHGGITREAKIGQTNRTNASRDKSKGDKQANVDTGAHKGTDRVQGTDRGEGQAQSQRPGRKCKLFLTHGHFCLSLLPMATFVSDLRTVLWGRNSDHNGGQWLAPGAVKHGKSIHSLPKC